MVYPPTNYYARNKANSVCDKSNVSLRTSVSSFVSSSIVSNACSKCKQTDSDLILDSREDQEWTVLLNGTVTPVVRKHFSNY